MLVLHLDDLGMDMLVNNYFSLDLMNKAVELLVGHNNLTEVLVRNLYLSCEYRFVHLWLVTVQLILLVFVY